MRRLEVDPRGIETIICSHGHFDHTTGLDGLIRRLERVNLPLLIDVEGGEIAVSLAVGQVAEDLIHAPLEAGFADALRSRRSAS